MPKYAVDRTQKLLDAHQRFLRSLQSWGRSFESAVHPGAKVKFWTMGHAPECNRLDLVGTVSKRQFLPGDAAGTLGGIMVELDPDVMATIHPMCLWGNGEVFCVRWNRIIEVFE